MASQVTSAHLRKVFWLLPLLLLASFVQLVEGTEGGVKVQISQKGLEYAKDLGIEQLKKFMKEQPIPNVKGSYKVTLVGTVDYSLSEIQVTNVQMDHSSASFAEGTGLNLTIQDAQVLLKTKWSLSAWLGSDKGMMDINMKNLYISTLLGVEKDDHGRPRVLYANCHSAIGDLELKFYGKTSWIFNRLAPFMKNVLKKKVSEQMCSEIKKGVSELDRLLGGMNVSAQIDSFAGVDYSLVKKPAIEVDRCHVDLKGEFFVLKGSPQSPSLLPVPFYLPKQSDSMVLLGVSEFFANSAALAYFMAGALQLTYTKDTISKKVPFRLNTNTVGEFIPQLKKSFPDMEMEFRMAVRKPPVLSIHAGSLHATGSASVEAFVVRPDASRVSAFLINIDSKLMGQVTFQPAVVGASSARLGGSLAMKTFHLSLERSSIGEIKVARLEQLLKTVAQLGLSSVNRHLKKGFVLPSAFGLSALNPKVTMEEGYLLIATDLHYEPHVTA